MIDSVTAIADRSTYDRAVAGFAARGITLPTFAELAAPSRIAKSVRDTLKGVAPDAPHAANLFRVHWYNDAARTGVVDVPGHVVLPRALTGVDAKIVVAFGDRFPMIGAHKVLAAYGVLAPRIVSGRFDPARDRALWPSTGNYCRGGVAISRILGCRGVAILPAEMSAERFEWLDRWVSHPDDVVRTPGSESNVKEIYDACARLSREPGNVVLNQFAEMDNHMAHYAVTGSALAAVYEHLKASNPALRASAFVSASGSAGTLAAGDKLKDLYGTKITAVEALECPTLLRNGFGAHHIQGIGDKHVPYIHNVMNTDVVAAVSDASTDSLFMLFNDDVGRRALIDERGISPEVMAALPHFGLSSICNVLAAVKTAKTLGLGANDAVLTVATDGAAMYASELPRILAQRFGGTFDRAAAHAALARHLDGASTENTLELRHEDRDRIFNLGYFTWVEQQGVSLADFEARRDLAWWHRLHATTPALDEAIRAFNHAVAERSA
ncbi:MAG: pyridoxal-phosphate dependent enzyme [Polyangiales bacterium]